MSEGEDTVAYPHEGSEPQFRPSADFQVTEGDRRIGLCGKGFEPLATAAGDVDDRGERLPSGQLEQGTGEQLGGSALRGRREVAGRSLRPPVEPPFAVQGVRPRLLPRPLHPHDPRYLPSPGAHTPWQMSADVRISLGR